MGNEFETSLFATQILGSRDCYKPVNFNCSDTDYEVESRLKRSARVLDKGVCQRCGACCYKAPCKVKDISNLKGIARNLNMGIKECFNTFFCIDKWIKGYYVVPIRVSQQDLAGRYINDERSHDKGKCLFFEEDSVGLGSCKIQRVKPLQGVNFFCNKEKIEDSYEWTLDDLRELISTDVYNEIIEDEV